MKKKLLSLFAISCFTLALGACNAAGGQGGGEGGGGETPTYYNVAFYVKDARYATARVKDGEKITQTINDPTPDEGYTFTGWYEGTTLVDLTTYTVTHDARFDAGFEEKHDSGPVLSVDDVKEAGHEYYAVFGWWETTDTNDDGTPKITSGLVKDDVRTIYKNLRTYLTIKGATEADLENIQFRNYSSVDVATMGGLINADADVDVLFGVGNNINTQAGVSLYGGTNDSKFQSRFGSANKDRYVACTSVATERGFALYEWLKFNNAQAEGQTYNTNPILTGEMTEQQVRDSLPPETLGITVTIHGDTDAVTVLDKMDDPITLPEITVPNGYHFVGYALTADGEVVLEKALGAAITYDDIKSFVTNKAVDLYPIFEANPVVLDDLVVYVQVNGNNLTLPEAKLLEARFNETLTTEKVKFNPVEGDAATFAGAVNQAADADVIIGGNNPVDPSKGYFSAHADGPTANAGAKHFANTSRKIIINGSVKADHLNLAKKLYNFVIADAPEFEVHATYWPKYNNSTAVTDEEMTAITAGMTANLKTYLNVGESDTLEGKYNVKLTTVEVTTSTDAGNNKAADMGEATRALRNGKGTDLIIGCGNNVDSASGAGMTIVEKKTIPTSIVANNRYVALVRDNGLTRNIYDVLFTVAA